MTAPTGPCRPAGRAAAGQVDDRAVAPRRQEEPAALQPGRTVNSGVEPDAVRLLLPELRADAGQRQRARNPGQHPGLTVAVGDQADRISETTGKRLHNPARTRDDGVSADHEHGFVGPDERCAAEAPHRESPVRGSSPDMHLDQARRRRDQQTLGAGGGQAGGLRPVLTAAEVIGSRTPAISRARFIDGSGTAIDLACVNAPALERLAFTSDRFRTSTTRSDRWSTQPASSASPSRSSP